MEPSCIIWITKLVYFLIKPSDIKSNLVTGIPRNRNSKITWITCIYGQSRTISSVKQKIIVLNVQSTG
jgi:hypothetical protein